MKTTSTLFKRAAVVTLLAAVAVGTTTLFQSVIGTHGSYAASTTQQTSPTAPAPLARPGFGMGQGMGAYGAGVAGTVTAISGDTITVKTPTGQTGTVTVASSTVYREVGTQVSLSDIHVGTQIVARGANTGSASVSASLVMVVPPHAAGQVTAVNGNTITITPTSGQFGLASTADTIVVTDKTTYTSPFSTASLASIKTGSWIMAIGSLSGGGKTLTADQVMVPPTGVSPGGATTSGPGFGMAGRMGFSPGMMTP